MVRRLQITVLVENTVRGGEVLAEHGLAMWIETDGRRILFDTGQGRVLQHNARQLGIDVADAGVIALSHGHVDHSGGLNDLLGSEKTVDLYLHPAALTPKFARNEQPPHRNVGMAGWIEPQLVARTKSLTWTRTPTRIEEGIWLTGEIPRRNDLEDTGGLFYRDPDCTQPDPIADDQAMYIETPAGTVVLLGCAHSGVINTLDYIFKLTDRRPIQAVLGGMHLLRAKPERLRATVELFRRHNMPLIAPAHCTGTAATAFLWSQLPGRCVECVVGTRFNFGALR